MTEKTTQPAIHPEPHMDSAGAEIVALSWRLADHPEFADDHRRIHEIGSHLSIGGISDMEKSLIGMIGSLVRSMRKRGVPFDDDLPMGPQFEAFLEALPDPAPGEPGHVDQATLLPIDRRDTFTASVEMHNVHNWTPGDGVPRAIARTCSVTPHKGIAGDAMIYAEGYAASRIREGATEEFNLRSMGGALRVEA